MGYIYFVFFFDLYILSRIYYDKVKSFFNGFGIYKNMNLFMICKSKKTNSRDYNCKKNFYFLENKNWSEKIFFLKDFNKILFLSIK